MINSILKAVPALVLLLFSFTCCEQKDKANSKPQPPEVNISLITHSATPGGLTQLDTGIRPETDPMRMSIGGGPVALYRINCAIALLQPTLLSKEKLNTATAARGDDHTHSFTINNDTCIRQPEALKLPLQRISFSLSIQRCTFEQL